MTEITYPKVYAAYAGRVAPEWRHAYSERGGDLVYAFVVVAGPDTGQIILMNQRPARAGGDAPGRIRRAYNAVTVSGRLNRRPRPNGTVSVAFSEAIAANAFSEAIAAKYLEIEMGTVVKLYKRGDQWRYRHLGR